MYVSHFDVSYIQNFIINIKKHWFILRLVGWNLHRTNTNGYMATFQLPHMTEPKVPCGIRTHSVEKKAIDSKSTTLAIRQLTPVYFMVFLINL